MQIYAAGFAIVCVINVFGGQHLKKVILVNVRCQSTKNIPIEK